MRGQGFARQAHLIERIEEASAQAIDGAWEEQPLAGHQERGDAPAVGKPLDQIEQAGSVIAARPLVQYELSGFERGRNAIGVAGAWHC